MEAGSVKDKNITEANLIKIWLVAAAVYVILFLVYQYACNYSGYGGSMAGGELYYNSRSLGLFKYSPKSGEKRVLRDNDYDNWMTDDTTLYYSKDKSLYKVDCETGTNQLLYEIAPEEGDRLYTVRFYDGNPVIGVESSMGEERYLVIDKEEGKIITAIDDSMYFTEGKQLSLSSNPNKEKKHKLWVDGVDVTPEGKQAIWVSQLGGKVLLGCSGPSIYVVDLMDDTAVELPGAISADGTEQYIYYATEKDEVYCYDTVRRDTRKICEQVEVYALEADEEWLYALVPWRGGGITCYKILYDSTGRPEGLDRLTEL